VEHVQHLVRHRLRLGEGHLLHGPEVTCSTMYLP
jgi:hypothetical protein